MVERGGGEGDGLIRDPYVSKICLPMRLYTESGRPVTDVNGVLLLNIAGKPLATIDVHNFVFLDLRGRLLTDAANRKPTDAGFDPTTKPQFESSSDVKIDLCPSVLFDHTGYPLTDMECRPLFNRDGTHLIKFGPRGEPNSDIYGGPLLDKMGRDLMKDERALIDANGLPLHIFDYFRRPLTDESGFSLLELSGVKLVEVDNNRKPIRIITGGELYDARGLVNTDTEYDLTRSINIYSTTEPIRTQYGRAAVAFDKNGHPLTDLAGIPLCFATGHSMMTKGNYWMDWRGERAIVIRKDVFIKYSLKGFKNSYGVPIRLFDSKGRPLTDYQGAPQNHASGTSLLIFDEDGDPISDWMGRPIYDASGYTAEEEFFRPCRTIKSKLVLNTIFSIRKKNPQYFDRFGLPLTNRHGIPLVNSNDEFIIDFDENGRPLRDIEGGPVFDITGLPIVYNSDNPLTGPQGLPIRLYNSKGMPLTDNAGRPLRHIRGSLLLSFLPNGKIENDHKGGKLYDRKLRPRNFVTEFNACQASLVEEKMDVIAKVNGQPLQLFDHSGHPLTDQNGVVLFDCRGRALIKCPEQGFIVTNSGFPVYDVNGCKCLRILDENIVNKKAYYDKNSRPLIDQRGNILQSRKGKELLVYKFGRPHEVLYGGGIFDSNNLPISDPKCDLARFPTWETHIIGDGEQLFDCDDLPLTDANGIVLYTSSGIPLVQTNSHGKPKSDHAGRAVFDSKGIPITRSSGCWKDQRGRPLRLYDSSGLPLTDQNGKELHGIDFIPLIRQDELGRPKFDRKNNYVYDSKGRPIMSPDFNPASAPLTKLLTLLESDGIGLKVFDIDGKPMTDESGAVLSNWKGKLLLDTKNGLKNLKDLHGRRVFDIFYRPLACDPLSPIISVCGKPMLLYNRKGEVLTSPTGVAFTREGETSIKFDKYSRPDTSRSGSGLYDSSGNQLTSRTFVSTSLSTMSLGTITAKSLGLFDDQGKPLTDETGKVISSYGTHLETKFCPANNSKTLKTCQNKLCKKSLFG